MTAGLVTPWDVFTAVSERRLPVPEAMALYRMTYARLVVAMLDAGHLMLAALVDARPRRYLAPVVWTGKTFVMRKSRVPLTNVEAMRSAGRDAAAMVGLRPELDPVEVAAYLADDLVETESIVLARADARDYAERRQAHQERRLRERAS